MDTTLPDDQSEASSSGKTLGWSLVLVHHRDRQLHGRRLLIPFGSACHLGRGGGQFGEGSLDDDRMSRQHVHLSCSAAGDLQLRDEGSRNGTFINGDQVETTTIADGDVLGLGRSLMVFRRAPPSIGKTTGTDAPVGVSHVFRDAVNRIERVVDRATPLLLTGPSGVGKSMLAQWFHRRTTRGGPLRTVHCAALAESALLREQLGQSSDEADALEGGTLLLEGIDQTPPRAQPVVVALLEHVASRSTSRPRVVSTSLTAPGGGTWNTDIARRAARWVVRVPHLDERPEDIALLADAFVQRFGGTKLRLERRYAATLIRRRWEGHVHELEVEVEASVIAADGDLVRATHDHPVGERAWLAERSAAWFEPPGGDRVDLVGRPTLRGILASLIEAKGRDANTALNVEQLLEAGWPDQGAVADSGANRVYVALTTLRRLGLKGIIIRNKTGYLLAESPQLL